MKKLIYFLFAIFLSFQLSAQNDPVDIYLPTSDLTDTELEIIEDAKDNITTASGMVTRADADYQQYKHLFNGNNRKKKKAEKKTVPAKRNLMNAGNYFTRGYQKLYDLYSAKLDGVVFQFQDDQATSDDLRAQAEDLFNEGKTVLDANKSFKDKQLKKTVKYQNLSSNIINGSNKEKEAVEKLAEALALYENQAQKQQDMLTQDNQAWQDALMENSISGFETYIQNYPNGLHVTEAEQKIEELRQKIADAQNQQNNPDLVYHVQIAASKTALSTSTIKSRVFFTTENIELFEEDDARGRHWYKYYIGSFSSYWDAHTYRKNMGRMKNGSKAFVIAFINGQKVEIGTALQAEGIDAADVQNQY